MIPFLDLAADFREVEPDARRRLDGVLARQQFVLGPETAELERALGDRLGAAAAVAVSSGSEALTLALMALGVGAGDAVIVPAFTFFASAGSVLRVGAEPVFCDIDPSSCLATAATMREAVDRHFRVEAGVARHRRSGSRLAAFLPVHLYGSACRMQPIVELARSLGAVVVEDAAQALGSRDGEHAAGLLGDAGCFSFYPTKNLGAAGDGGLVACADAELGRRLASLRTHGAEHGSYLHHEAGINARIGEMVAAVLNAKLPRLDAWTARRRAIAGFYDACLAPASARGLLELPPRGAAASHVWHQYVVRLAGEGRRDRVKNLLEAQGIATRVFYPLPLHLQPCFAAVGGREGDLPASETAAREVLALPVFASMRDEAVEAVSAALVHAAGAAA